MIDFTKITPFVSQFDTDILAQVVSAVTGETKYENVPCHFVIRQIDAAPGGGTVSTGYMPIITAGEVYTSYPLNIDDKDAVTVLKCDKAGNVLAAYQGQAGTIAVRGARSVFAVTLSKITPPLPPQPIEYSYWYFDEGRNKKATTQPIKCYIDMIEGDVPALVIVDENMVYEDRNNVYYPDPISGNVYIKFLFSRFWKEGESPDSGIVVQSNPQQLENGDIIIYDFIG